MTITWDSQFDLHSTYGVISTRMCEELLKLGVDIRIKPWSESTKISRLLNKCSRVPGGFKVRMSGINSISNLDDFSFIPDFVPSFQSPNFDKQMAMLNAANHLIIPSQYQKVAFDALSLKASVIPRGSDFTPIHRKQKKNYTFLFIGYLSKYKGLHYLAEAYKRSFTGEENVKLILKGNDIMTHPDQMTDEQIKKIFGRTFKTLEIIRENWDYSKLLKLYKRSDCFVSPHCSLGAFGTRVALDARKTGLPLIAPKYGDVKLWHDQRFLVPYKLRDDGIELDIEKFGWALGVCYKYRVNANPLPSESWTWEEAAKQFIEILYEKSTNLGR